MIGANQCVHGRLARKCEICEAAQTIELLEAVIADALAHLEVDEIDEAMVILAHRAPDGARLK